MQWKFKGWKGRWLWVFLAIVLCAVVVAQKIGDPYKILGVHRKASLPEIRKAYRQLAKEWHPDKSEDPNAETRFVEIKQAYELLSDTERRQAYDLYGITNEDDHMYKQRHDYSQYARFSSDPFEDFFGTHFRTQDQDITLFHKLSVTARHFENNIIEKSVHTPAVVLFYTDWCFDCVRSASAWRRLVDALQPLGVTMATVHAGHESGLARRVGVHGVPCLTLVLDKHVYVYKEGLSSLPKILEFIRWKFPYKMVRPINNGNMESFVSDFEDNKVKALIFEERPSIRLRYLITAFHYRSRVAFGFVDMTSRDTQSVSARFGVQRHTDTMVLLKEDSAEPCATVSTGEIPTQTLRQLISANQMLTLPRLSEQSVFDAVCPVEWRASRRRLCCVLLCGTGVAADNAREEMRRLAKSAPERLHYAYVYTHKQPYFVQALANGSGSDSTKMNHRIVIIWRRESTRIQYEWLNETWPSCAHQHCSDLAASQPDLLAYQQKLNETKRSLEQLIKRLLKPNEVMAYETSVQELLDEAARGPLWSAALKLCEWWERALLALRTHHAVSLASVLATVALVLCAGYLVQYLVRVEEESIQRQKEERRKQNGNKKNNNEPQPEMKLHELRAEKYNGLVRLLKPGCRTIVLLVDMQSRVQLLSKFHKIVWPYRKNKTLLFAYLMVERNIEWFRRVLQLSLGGAELRVNARNCVGTVLALNPHRKYFCIYHAKHPECAKPHKRMSRMTRSLGGGAEDPEAGAFIGFHADLSSSSGDDVAEPVLLLENLLDGLENWLDRLFEGSTHRYYINYWPDMTTK
ncbi:dnaJ homolog subfamily C member 16 isoform X1 [Plodia interpunctella]|uniref:dnaJ homolog subfamily C member 16 isoform X1 n=1 Tax=Plodia interpunctella TaxID=58824 RepID=UPI002367513E|nr:dnaJ homolog subfamily C member 16 isoform X1 [Plodia interpunctella]